MKVGGQSTGRSTGGGASSGGGISGYFQNLLDKFLAVVRLFFSSIFNPKDYSAVAGSQGGNNPGGNVRRINPGTSSSTQFGGSGGGGGGDDDNDFMRRGRMGRS
eukprot:TRINITY_DN80364_c0_g1_i1.p1 TRINITY_DN80364_c0_g1~~TRINITY_DN80364_c0_g1_i1.p1  ORF type:complete len:104 (+),score=23.25 TRINITY_DN80364_c0_g1_i1:62-373(+)